MADIKGDLSGMTMPGGDNAKVVERAANWDFREWCQKISGNVSGTCTENPASGEDDNYGDGPLLLGGSST